MSSVGELIRESADLNEQGHSALAFHAACAAFRETVARIVSNEDPKLPELRAVIDENWEMIRFLSMPAVDSAYVELSILIKEISLNPRRRYTAKEITIHLVSQTLRLGKLPDGFGFTRANQFEKKANNLLLPVTLISGLLAFAVLHPVNKEESIPDKYWISISDFKMFISELWGRMDLAVRIRKFYLDR